MVSTEGLFAKDSSNTHDCLIPWHQFTLAILEQVKKNLRRGNDFTIGPRKYLDTDGNLIATIGVAFASPEFLFEYGLEMHPDGHVTPLKQ